MRQSSLLGGLVAFVGLVLYFFLMKSLGLIHVVELRALNLLFLIGGILFAIKWEQKHWGKGFNYFDGLISGAGAGLMGVIPFALFIFIYLEFIDPAFMQQIREQEIMGHYLTSFNAAFVIFIEGTASGLLATYTIMQYIKAHIGYHQHENHS
ncbi:DUF4199 domain-containing protein [Algivirga pacifica]|uniref:DUF4199 domain-containing protein n=1 Tax=Algivirga pacifica TaxID=1162670 RepID=A0ABP9D1L6_9BACT